ncbi:putative ethanolamine kinase [Drosera capensis]
MGAESKKKKNNIIAGDDDDGEAMAQRIPSSLISVDVDLSLDELKPRIVELCKDLFERWSDLDASRFEVETVSGGITNLLLKVTVMEETGHVVPFTVRLYGPNTDYVINRERELLAIRHLSDAGFGAKLLATFQNGMVQSFIDARTLTAADMRDHKLIPEIAKEVRKFHQVKIPGSKEPQLWVDIAKFFDKASSLRFDDSKKQERYEKISFDEIKSEINQLKQLTDRLKAPVVFSHNDLLSGNLMLDEEQGKLYLIDFEYGSYSYRGFDIGNHFNEYAGYDCDYRLYPSKDGQCHFFRHYLNPDGPDEVTESELEAIYVETNTFMLASHLYWALWALIQASVSPIKFDYLEYFFLRYNEYKRRRDAAMSLAECFLSRS